LARARATFASMLHPPYIEGPRSSQQIKEQVVISDRTARNWWPQCSFLW